MASFQNENATKDYFTDGILNYINVTSLPLFPDILQYIKAHFLYVLNPSNVSSKLIFNNSLIFHLQIVNNLFILHLLYARTLNDLTKYIDTIRNNFIKNYILISQNISKIYEHSKYLNLIAYKMLIYTYAPITNFPIVGNITYKILHLQTLTIPHYEYIIKLKFDDFFNLQIINSNVKTRIQNDDSNTNSTLENMIVI